jgi:hypothetical protein
MAHLCLELLSVEKSRMQATRITRWSEAYQANEKGWTMQIESIERRIEQAA